MLVYDSAYLGNYNAVFNEYINSLLKTLVFNEVALNKTVILQEILFFYWNLVLN